jgi:CheY-like chemotaxis protein
MARKILIVDDNSDCRCILARYLHRLGYDTLQAENSGQAIRKAITEHPDLILTDFRLPDMHAVDAVAILKRDPSAAKIPIVVLTGMADARYKRQAIKAGVAKYLLKPISLHKLTNEIKTLTETGSASCDIATETHVRGLPKGVLRV